MSLSFGYGKVAETRPGQVRVELEDQDGMLSPWLRVLYRRTKGDKEFDTYAEGELVAYLLTDNGEDGAVIGSAYSQVDEPPTESNDVWTRTFEDGTTLSYDRASKALQVEAKGPVTIQADADVTIQCAAGKNILLGGGDEVLVKKSWLTALEARLDANETATVTAVGAAGPGGPAAGPVLQSAYTASKSTYAAAKATGATTRLKGG